VVNVAELVSKQRQPYLGYHAMDEIIPPAVESVAVMAQGQGVDFRVFVPSDLPRGHVDAGLVKEAVYQMAQNDVTFNQPGGHAEVSAHVSDDMIIVEVSDTGVALTSQRLASLRRPFHQSADALRQGEEGLGIGWALVCYVAEAHGGWTDVKSAGKGEGSTFSLALPAASKA
jgi:signal transduction histidine kinase